MEYFLAECPTCGEYTREQTEKRAEAFLRRHVCYGRYALVTLGRYPPDSIEERIEKYRGYTMIIIKQMAQRLRGKVEYDDVYCYGMIGLWNACKDYDEERGFLFTTYASHRIRGAILDGARDINIFSRAMVKNPEKLPSIISLDEPRFNNDTPSLTLLDTLADPNDDFVALDEAKDSRVISEGILKDMENLSVRNRRICELYLMGWHYYQIAELYGITESRVCQIWTNWVHGLRRRREVVFSGIVA